MPVAQTGWMDMGGRAERRFEAVREAFRQVLAGQAGTGAAVAAWWDGAWVVDLWGGPADAAGTRPWRADSLVRPYSVSRPFAGVCALVLVDRGQLELDAPVQRWLVSWSGVPTGAGRGVSCARRSAGRWAWTSLSGSPQPSGPGPLT